MKQTDTSLLSRLQLLPPPESKVDPSVATAGTRGGPWSKYFKVGWARKSGVAFKQIRKESGNSSSTAASVDQNLQGSSYRMSVNKMPPLLSSDVFDTTTSVKTRFLLLSDFRLRYGSTSTYEAFQALLHLGRSEDDANFMTTTSRREASQKSVWSSAVDRINGVTLGELFLTGDAWVRPVGSGSLLVSGDSAMQRKAGKLYLLTFRNADERMDWEIALNFFLVRAVPSERYERLLLSGWISAFPNLSNRMDRLRARKMSVVAPKGSSAQKMGRAVGTTELKKTVSSMSGPALPKSTVAAGSGKPRSSSQSPRSTAVADDDENDEGGKATLYGDLVSEEDSTSSSSEQESLETSSGPGHDIGAGDAAAISAARKGGPSSASRGKDVIAHLLRGAVMQQTAVGAADLSIDSKVDAASTAASADAASTSIVTFALDSVNGEGMPFVLRCQRSSILHHHGDKPQPSYLRVEWRRSSHTAQAEPCIRETLSYALASRFALRSFAEGAGNATPRVVWVESPGWQLYLRSDPEKKHSDRELALVPIIETMSLPSPGVVSTEAEGLSPRFGGRRGSQYVGAPISRLFKAISWEGSLLAQLISSPSHQGASFSFLLEAATTNGPKQIVSLSMSGKLILVAEDLASDLEPGSLNTGEQESTGALALLEVVPAVSDHELTDVLKHQTPAMRQKALYRAANKGLSLSFLQENLVEPVRIVLVGASGSGKTTIATWLRKFSVSGGRPAQVAPPADAASPAASPAPLIASDISVASTADYSASEIHNQLLQALNREVCAVNCCGIAVPIVVTDVTSTSNDAFLQSQCSGADIVICVFDLSDDHSLWYLEQRLRHICGRSSPQAASRNTFPKTRYVLCGTRSDSLRIAVDGYRLAAFQAATVAFTGPVDDAWDVPLAPSKKKDNSGSEHRQSNASFGYYGVDGTSFSSVSGGSSDELSQRDSDQDASKPFYLFGSLWRTWRLPTAARGFRKDERASEWEMLRNATLTDSFVLSPNLKRMAAEGVAQALHVQSPFSATLPPAASPHLTAPPVDDYPATPKRRGETGSDFDDDDDDDETPEELVVPRLTMTLTASVLEELHLIRFGRSLGWKDEMLLRFAAAAAKLPEAVSHMSSNEPDSTSRDLYHKKATDVVTMLRLLRLPEALQFDAAQEVLHRGWKMREAAAAPHATVGGGDRTPLSTLAQHRFKQHANNSMNASQGIGTPTASAAANRSDMQQLLLNTSISAIGVGGVSLNASMRFNSSMKGLGGSEHDQTGLLRLEATLLNQSIGAASFRVFRKKRDCTPSWRDVLGFAVPAWSVPWLVLRWLCTGWSLGDVRCEWIMSHLWGHFGSCVAANDLDDNDEAQQSPKGAAVPVRFHFPHRIAAIVDEAPVTSVSTSAPSSNNEGVVIHRPALAYQDAFIPVSAESSGLILLDFCTIVPRLGSGSGRLFHPLDVWYWASNVTPPTTAPPASIRKSALWLYRVTSSGAATHSAHAVTSLSNHASQQMIMHLFRMCGIDVGRDHAGTLLRWADMNGDRLTDVSDFLRWYCQLMTASSGPFISDAAVSHPHNTSGTGNSSGTPPQAVGRFLTMLSVLWSVRTLQRVPVMSSLSAALSLGLSDDRADACATFSTACHVPVHVVIEAVAQHARTQQALERSRRGGKVDLGRQTLDSSISTGAVQSSKADVPSPKDQRSSPFSRMLGAIKGTSLCNLCRAVFRPFIRTPVTCQECHKEYCAKCCSYIVVLDDDNRTVKRQLCKRCRRAHSTFMDDDEGGREDGSPASTQPASPNYRGLLDSRSSNGTTDHGSVNAGSIAASVNISHASPYVVTGNVIWEDNAQTTCSICTSAFTMMRRRHHCRVCGALVCASCSPFMKEVVGYNVPQRVCKSCHLSRETLLMQQQWRTESSPSMHPSLSGTFDVVTLDDFGGDDVADDVTVGQPSNDVVSVASKARGQSVMSSSRGVGRVETASSIEGEESSLGGVGGLGLSNMVARGRLNSQFLSSVGGVWSDGNANRINEVGAGDAARQRKWRAWAELKENVPFELTWRESYTELAEKERLRAAEQSLLEQARLTRLLQGTAAGRAALLAERGPQWNYTVLQPGYFALHDGDLEVAFDRATMEELGPDLESH